VSLLMVFHALGSTELVEDVVLKILENPLRSIGCSLRLLEASIIPNKVFLRFGGAKSSLYTVTRKTFIHNIR
jgi:hypothetical protein